MTGIKDRLIQFVLRGKDELSPEAEKAAEALEALEKEAAALGEALDSSKQAQGLVTGLTQTQRAVEQVERAIVQGDLQIKELREALDKAPESAGLQQSLKDAEREARRAQRQLDKLRETLGDQQKAAQAAGVDTDRLGDEQTRLADEVEKAKRALAENNEQLKAAQREQAKAARQTAEHTSRLEASKQAMAGAGRQVLSLVAAYVSLNAVFGLVQRGLGTLRRGIDAVIAGGSEEEQALRQLEAALASTGNAAGLTSQQLLEMAQAMEASSMLTSEQILSAQTRLLSYTDIAGKDLPAALQITIDQAERLGISVEQSAEIVGRALQSPAEAMAALGRQGFKLEAGQKELLQRLVATGRTAEAQAVIMNMLTEAYGGAAAAARMGTFAGLLKTISDQFGDFAKRVSSAGIFEYLRGKLQSVSDKLREMEQDGRLDRLAEAVSNAFIQGAKWVENFARQLVGVDFKRLTDDSTNWLNTFGTKLDETKQRIQLFVAPFRSLFNGLTAGLSLAAAAVTNKFSEVLTAIEKVAEHMPKMLGGEKLRAAIAEQKAMLDGLTKGFVEQVEQDGKDLRSAWDVTTQHVAEKAAEQTEAITQAADDQFEHVVQRVTDINNALAQITAASSAQQLRQIGEEMYKAYQRGDLSQQAYAQGTAVLQDRLRSLGGAARGASGGVAGLSGTLNDLASVQQAIANAQTDVEITKIKTALRKLYETGVITADQYNAELEKINARQRELKGALEQTARAGKEAGEQLTRAQEMYNEALEDGIVTSEEARRISGQRMEEERRSIGEAMEARRKGNEEAKRDLENLGDWTSGVLSGAREPLAQMSAAALEAYDRLRGLATTSAGIDTSGLDATRASLRGVLQQLEEVKAAQLTVGLSGFSKWALETQRASLEVQASYLGQKKSLQSLLASYQSGRMQLSQFIEAAKGAASGLSLLDQSDLSSLESAIASAEQRMQALGDSTRNTLESLQSELDQLQGREAAVEERRFAQRRRELEAQREEARASGNNQAVADLTRAIGLLREIEAETAQQRFAKAQQAQQPTPAATPQPAQVIRLETARGQKLDVSVPDGQQTQLLDILNEAGLRTL